MIVVDIRIRRLAAGAQPVAAARAARMGMWFERATAAVTPGVPETYPFRI